jgi:hypothetical protein
MDTKKLYELIDKVIGKSGPLRTPAWWMQQVLKDIMKYCDNIKTDITKELTIIKASISKTLKTPM